MDVGLKGFLWEKKREQKRNIKPVLTPRVSEMGFRTKVTQIHSAFNMLYILDSGLLTYLLEL